jgi:hypothetical protein
MSEAKKARLLGPNLRRRGKKAGQQLDGTHQSLEQSSNNSLMMAATWKYYSRTAGASAA